MQLTGQKGPPFQGNIREVVTPAGVVSDQWPWLDNAFGTQPMTGNSNYYGRFPGQYYDVETGLHYNGYRYYEPTTGRYDQPDPLDLKGGINPYVYGLNDPLTYVDPLGLCPGDDQESGRYEICNQSQDPNSSWLTNKVKMWGCKKSVDAACNASHDADTCCKADYRGCTGGKNLGEPPDNPTQGMKMGQCMVKFTQCMSSGGKGSE